MRTSELTYSRPGDHSIKMGINKDKIMVVLYTSEMHNKSDYTQQKKISPVPEKDKLPTGRPTQQRRERLFCHFRAIRNYISLQSINFNRMDKNFFIFRDGSPLHPEHVREVLMMDAQQLHLDPSLYNCQSLRISHASDLLKAGNQMQSINT